MILTPNVNEDLEKVIKLNLPSSVRPSDSQMWHHVSRLFNVIHCHFKIPLLIKSRALDSADKYIRSDARHMIHELRLKEQIFSRQQKVANIILRRAYRDAVTDA